MHMANELLSVPVAGATLGIAAAGLGFVCKSEELVLDYGANGNLVGIDINNASKKLDL
jgi:hypothetical protein